MSTFVLNFFSWRCFGSDNAPTRTFKSVFCHFAKNIEEHHDEIIWLPHGDKTDKTNARHDKPGPNTGLGTFLFGALQFGVPPVDF